VRPILTAEAMRAAEQRAIDAGTSVETLMERAGAALAEAAYRYVGKMPALILCGPGNNGGDGYVAGRHLAQRGVDVRVAALGEPQSPAAKWARSKWTGDVEPLNETTAPGPLLIDALFGTGLKKGLEDTAEKQFLRLASAARIRVACDLPSGSESDTGQELSRVPAFDLTVTFGALKPAHRLSPAMHNCGRVVLADIGIETMGSWQEIGRPVLPPLSATAFKYTRGMVLAVAGEMPGAITLAASAAARCGAGYVRVNTPYHLSGLPSAIVQLNEETVRDHRLGCLLVGPGMGARREILDRALESPAPKVIDADALSNLGDPGRLHGKDAILTPHAGEFLRLFGEEESDRKPEQTLRASQRADAVVVFKGPDTVVAAPDGRVALAPPAPAWLATAGTGDVLSGMIAALRSRRMEAFDAACAAVWLHGRAAEIAGPEMIADDLVEAIPAALRLLND
jgi:hydroxyethylthiazole kinase-like uncharacterized protein yjeF